MFKVKTVYDENDLMMLFRVNRWPKDGGRKHPILKKIGFTAGIILVALMLLSGIMNFIAEIKLSLSGVHAARDSYYLGFVFWLAIGLFLVINNGDWIWKKASWKSYQEKGTELNFCFSETGFTVLLPTSSSEILYSGLARLYEDASCYVLMLPTNADYVLRKSAFIEGDPEQFRDFIQQKTGKPVTVIK